MFVNILRIASPLQFFLPSFLPSGERSLFFSISKEKFFFFQKLNKFSSTPPSKRIVIPFHPRFNNDSPFFLFWHISIQIFTL